MKKEAIAAKVSKEVKEKIDQIVKESKYLGLTQSRIISEILEMYFDANHAHGEKIRGRMIERMKREGWVREKYIEHQKNI